jgi:hypothetical protein
MWGSKRVRCGDDRNRTCALDDLIDLIAGQLKDLAGLITRQQNLEKKYR